MDSRLPFAGMMGVRQAEVEVSTSSINLMVMVATYKLSCVSTAGRS